MNKQIMEIRYVAYLDHEMKGLCLSFNVVPIYPSMISSRWIIIDFVGTFIHPLSWIIFFNIFINIYEYDYMQIR